MDVRAVLGDVAELGPFFTVHVPAAAPGPPDPGAGWRPAAAVYADPVPVRERIAHVRRVLGSDERVAASIAFQGLAALLTSAPLAAVVLHGVLPRFTGGALYLRPAAARPWELACPAPAADRADDVPLAAAALAALLVEEHLDPLVAAVRAQVSIAERLLWGNVASSVAAAKRLLAAQRPASARRAAAVAGRLLDTGPLAGTGVRLPPAPPDRDWSFRRRSCCLYYRVPDGGLCGDCVLRNRRSAR